MRKRPITARELKAKCLSPRRRPVATLQQVNRKSWKSPEGAWVGKVEIIGDIVDGDTSHLWDALRKS